jgi:ribosomal protein S18 acetylase RimI-like enzyme
LADGLIKPAGSVTLRESSSDDRDFLIRLYSLTREAELKALDWGAAQWAAFVGQQFAAQDRQYRATYPDGRFQIVELDGRAVGRLYVHRLPSQLHVIDIALLPAHRGRGIGSALIRDLVAEADAAGLAVTLHVQAHNPARRLYERFGFRRREPGLVYEFMERPVAGDQLKTASY